MNGMKGANNRDQDFSEKLTKIILENLTNEKFGVDDLAQAAGLTPSALRRKLRSVSKQPAIQLIREVRLQKAMDLLQKEDATISEVAYNVGFGSPAYFTKCFHDYFGYPPGETKNRINNDLRGNGEILEKIMGNRTEKHPQKKLQQRKILFTAGIVLTIFIIYILTNNLSFQSFSLLPGKRLKSADKSIVVMTMQNLNGDEEKTHFAYGITENILTNLFKIKGIKVINTPVTYTENPDSLKKIAKDYNVRFIFTGTVRNSGDNVIIIPKLKDIREYDIVWINQYNNKLNDIFQVTSNIAQQVALQLQIFITKSEKEQIGKIPTTNQEAYSYYLMGRYLLYKRTFRDPDTSKYITPFKKAIALDPKYAEAYALLAEVYFTVTRTQNYPRPEGFVKAKENAHKALLLDNKLSEAHAILGAIYYLNE